MKNFVLVGDADGITVREALQIGELKNAKVVAGEKGLDRIINFVITMDVPDAAKWIRGNELLLTAAYVFMNNPDMEKTFVYDLVEKNCSALAIKPGRFIDRIPLQIIEPANEKNFPIIELPVYVAWHDIVNPVLIEILNKEAKNLKRSQEIHDELMKVVLHGGGLEAIAESLSNLLNCTVFIEDDSFNILSYSNYKGAMDDLSKEIIENRKVPFEIIKELNLKGILNQIRNLKKPVRVELNKKINCFPRIITPIIIKDEIYGYISIIENDKKLQELDIIAAEQASTIAAIEILKRQAVKQAEGKVRRDFYEDILTGNIEDLDQIKNRLKLYGIDLRDSIVVMIIYLDNEIARKLEEDNFETLKNLLDDNGHHIILRKADKIVIILGFSKEMKIKEKYQKVNNLWEVILNRFKGLKDVKIGVSDFHDNILEISEAYKEAQKVLDISAMLKNGSKSIFYKDIWIYDFILNCRDRKILGDYLDKRLLKLIDYDLKNKEENLLITLKVFLNNMGKHNITAEKLYIHRNTLAYRLNKIKEIIGYDIEDPPIRLKLEIGLRMLELL